MTQVSVCQLAVWINFEHLFKGGNGILVILKHIVAVAGIEQGACITWLYFGSTFKINERFGIVLLTYEQVSQLKIMVGIVGFSIFLLS